MEIRWSRKFLTRNRKGTSTRVEDVHRYTTTARHTRLQKDRGAVSNLARYFLRWHDKHDAGRAQLHVLAVDAADPPNSCKYDEADFCICGLSQPTEKSFLTSCGRPVLKATPAEGAATLPFMKIEPKEPNNCRLPDWLVNVNWWKAKVGKEKKAPI